MMMHDAASKARMMHGAMSAHAVAAEPITLRPTPSLASHTLLDVSIANIGSTSHDALHHSYKWCSASTIYGVYVMLLALDMVLSMH